MPLIIKACFRTFKRYEKPEEIFGKVGLAGELRAEGIQTEAVGGKWPRLELTFYGSKKRAVFILPEADLNTYALLLPYKWSLYSRIYAVLKSKKFAVDASALNIGEVRIPPELMELLHEY